MAIIAALLICAAAAWLVTADQAASMSVMGGVAMLGAGLFLATWVVMMVAMMFPSVAPMVLTHARIVRSRGSHPFARVEELQTRGLVTARVFADIKDMVTIR